LYLFPSTSVAVAIALVLYLLLLFFPGINIQDFLAHGTAIVKQGFDYFESKVIDPEGTYYEIMHCYRGAKLFNPLVAKYLRIQELEALADDLSNFKFVAFTPAFLGRLKKDIPRYMNLLGAPFDWESLPGASEWASKQKEPNRDWQEDQLEVARRIWEWWRIHREKFHYMKEAVRLVVLVQVSSAAVERVFSRLRLILETTQEGVLHDAITIRLFEAVNSKYYDI
jgi:hypothetical protein